MRSWKLIMIILLLIFIFSSASLDQVTVGFDNEEIVLKQLQGEVQYKSRGWWIFTGPWKTVKDQAQLNKGDYIKTGDRGRAELFYLNEARILIEENSRIQIKENKREELEVKKLKLDEGSVIVEFMENIREKTSFEVKTPTGVAGVRGTLFRVKVNDQNETVVSVQEGTVDLSTDKTSVKVKGEETAVVRKQGQKPEIKQFDRNEIKQWQQSRSILKETGKKSKKIRENLKEKNKKNNSESQKSEVSSVNKEENSNGEEKNSDNKKDKSDNKPEKSPPASQQSDSNSDAGKAPSN